MTTFEALGLSPKILKALEKTQLKTPTPIQAQSIPPIMAGKDLMGLAQTGGLGPELLARLGLDAPLERQSAAPAQSPATAIVPPQSQKSEIGRVLEMTEPLPPTSVRTVSTTTVRIDDLLAGAAPGGADLAAVPVPSAPVGDPVVAQVQSILADLGYAPGKVDGFIGPGTRNAIASFRANYGLASGDGISADLMAELSRVSGVTIVR